MRHSGEVDVLTDVSGLLVHQSELIFTDKQYEESFGTSDIIGAPLVTKTEYLLLDLDDDQLTLMHQESGDVREDIDLPTVSHLSDIVKLIKKIHTTGKKECLVTVQHFDNREQVYSVREGNDAWKPTFHVTALLEQQANHSR